LPRAADIFDEMFGDMMGVADGAAAQRGQDLRYNMEITLEEAFHGKKAKITVPSSIACEPCKGTAPKNAPRPATARPAAVPAKCAASRASSRSSAPAPCARARAR